MKHIQTITFTQTGDLNSIQIIHRPLPEPKDNQVQIQVCAAALSVADFKSFSEKMERGQVSLASRLLCKPGRPFGGDVSGIISKVGKRVKSLKVGDAVYASIGTYGGCAEYIVADENLVALKPQNLTFEEAAAIPTAGIVAMAACQKATIRPQSDVLIYGASGGVGSFAIQIAKAMGSKVTAVCSTRNIDAAFANGANEVIDYRRESISSCARQYDAILGVNGNQALHTYKSLLKPSGTYVAIGGDQAMAGLVAPLYAFGSGKQMTFIIYAFTDKRKHLKELAQLAESGQLKPYIESVCEPSDVKHLLERICRNHATGKNIISMKQ